MERNAISADDLFILSWKAAWEKKEEREEWKFKSQKQRKEVRTYLNAKKALSADALFLLTKRAAWEEKKERKE